VGRYVKERVIAEEWPLIIRAHSLATSGNFRAILALDLEWGGHFGMRPEAEASFRVGQRQLNRLRPLRDARVVQRYLAAVESGQAHGWHPIVFGVVLAVFGVPLRHGLLHFARQVASGFLTEPGSESVELPHDIEHGLTTALSTSLPFPSLTVV
jgi:urease accessory protein UreF